jgi:hypothetical protein
MIYRGTIIGLFREKGGSGIALLGIEDDVRGRVLIPCDGNPTVRVLNVAFPGALRDGKFHNSAIEGERIYYGLDEVGVLKSFSPEDRESVEMIEEYEKQTAPPPKKKPVRFVNRGWCKSDDPIYSSGPIVNGRPLFPPTKKVPPSGPGGYIDGGLAEKSDPIYRTGPIVQGREILKPPPKKDGTGKVIVGGSLPPDHPIFSRGPMIFGRPDPPKKKSTDN